jgi:hypothetical protein
LPGFPSLQLSVFREIRSLIAADNSLFDCLGNLRPKRLIRPRILGAVQKFCGGKTQVPYFR